MKIFIIAVTLLFSFSSLADCVDQAIGFSFLYKLQGKIANQIEEKSKDLCGGQMMEDEWKLMQEASSKMQKIVRNDLKTKKKTSSEYLYDLDLTGEITEDQICKGVEKKVDDQNNECYPTSSLYKSLLSKNVASMSLNEACKVMAPAMVKARSECVAKYSKKDNREPPGDEIAPADDEKPVAQKSFFKEQGIRKTEAIQPAKTNLKFKTGSAASSQ